MLLKQQTGDGAVLVQVGKPAVNNTEVYVREVDGYPTQRVSEHEADTDYQVLTILGHGPQQDIPVLPAGFRGQILHLDLFTMIDLVWIIFDVPVELFG